MMIGDELTGSDPAKKTVRQGRNGKYNHADITDSGEHEKQRRGIASETEFGHLEHRQRATSSSQYGLQAYHSFAVQADQSDGEDGYTRRCNARHLTGGHFWDAQRCRRRTTMPTQWDL